ncbi:MAG: GMC family oxidoreductase N-terminal domain-containing protein, partial [Ramlibacter sp.]|nr:GMC family oxidoreductase N-terminal domain-containing protein [Ramlibacter sp.]
MTTEFGTRRISRDLSDLYREEREAGGEQLFYDVVIVGSGYGGALAAAELAGRKTGHGQDVKVLVLERGKEYVPGMFPSSAQEMPSHVRVHRSQSGETTGYHDGLFDIRIGPDVCALVGNGLGGGSLINAGVMEVPKWEFVPRMPDTLKSYLNAVTFQEVKQSLGAATGKTDNTIELHTRAPEGTAKTRALKSLDPGKFRYPALTVEMLEDAELPRCELCGDCMTGCNVGAKKSLDTSLLLTAFHLGAQIRTGASVKSVERSAEPGLWEVAVVFTGESLRRRHKTLRIRAGKVILAAGTLGSPEILMQSQRFALKFSPRLGQQFSCNGDNILAMQDAGQPTNPVAREHESLQGRTVGPTITGIIDVDVNVDMKVNERDSGPPFMIQEFAVPAALKRIFDEAVTTSSLLHRLAEKDSQAHGGEGRGTDPLAVNQKKMDKVLLLGLIGHDESSGRLKLPVIGPMEEPRVAEGRIQIDWPDVKNSRMLDDAYDRAKDLILRQPSKLPVLANPLWRMLPEQLDFVFRTERGPVLTVHP